jgi:RimJ/RimL family protein N-acetyltransferase
MQAEDQSTGGVHRDAGRSIADRIARAMKVLSGAEEPGDPTVQQLFELSHLAARRLGCMPSGGEERLGRRRTRLPVLLRRTLLMAAACYRRRLEPLPDASQEVLADFGAIEPIGIGPTFSADSSHAIAAEIARGEGKGVRAILMLGTPVHLAVAAARLSGQRVVLVPLQTGEEMSGTEVLWPSVGDPDLDLRIAGPLQPGSRLPFWLKGRFQSAVIWPPCDPIKAHQVMQAAFGALEPAPGCRLYWIGHPARHLDYFGLFSMLGRHGWMLERLVPEAGWLPLDAEFAEQVLSDALETPEVASLLDARLLEDLLSDGREHEHLHVFGPVEEIRIVGHELDLDPVRPRDIDLYHSWLTPEFCREVGLDDDEPAPARQTLQLENWYPGHEWWILRAKDGRGVGVVHLVLNEFWSTRSLTWDIGLVDKTLRGTGLLDDVFRLGFRRFFDQLGAELLWADLRQSNVPLLRGARKNFCRPTHVYLDPRLGVEFEHWEIPAEEYRRRRASGEIIALR